MSGNIKPIRPGVWTDEPAAQGGQALPFRGRLSAPFESIRIEVDLDRNDGRLRLLYTGRPHEVVAAGLIAADYVAPGRTGVGKSPLVDANGDMLHRKILPGHRVCVKHTKGYERCEGMPGFEHWMIEAARQARAEKARAELQERCGLTPEAFREKHIDKLASWLDRLGRFDERDEYWVRAMWGGRPLSADYQVNQADADAYRERLLRAEQDLTALLRTMRIERVAPAPQLRLVKS